jgi:hypothetical protein
MTIIVSFVVLTVLVSYWWLWAHRITEKPWLVEGHRNRIMPRAPA